MTKILVAVDGSSASDHAAASARSLFGDDAEFLAVSVVPNPSTLVDPVVGFGVVSAYYPLASDPEVRRQATAEARHDAADAMHHAGLDDAEIIAPTGDPAEVILEAAEVHAVDVIVVAASDKGWFSRLVVGSVSESVVRRARVPVLVVH